MSILSELKCLVNPFQNGTEMKPSKDLRIYAMGRKRFLQILKCNVVDSGIYTCDAGDTTTSCNVEVYGKFCKQSSPIHSFYCIYTFLVSQSQK